MGVGLRAAGKVGARIISSILLIKRGVAINNVWRMVKSTAYTNGMDVARQLRHAQRCGADSAGNIRL